jgi:hypothetical protein
MLVNRFKLPGLSMALAAVLLIVPSGCGTSIVSGIDAAFFVGTWGLVSVTDGSGDRTNAVNQVVDEMFVTFTTEGAFTLIVHYTPATGQPEQTINGTYAVTPTGQLILTTPEAALAFNATAEGNNTVALTAPAALVEAVIAGTGADIGLVGSVTLRLGRISFGR